MESFDITTLRLFLAVARSGSIGAAARNEHIAASAVSRRISDLEHDLDTVLITRTPGGTRVTSAGKAFAENCEQLLSKCADIRADLKRFADGKAGDFRVVAIPRALDGELPSIIAQFKKDNTDIRVTMQEIFSRQGIRCLREDIADMAIIYDSVDLKGFKVLPYRSDAVWVVGNKNHQLFKKHQNSDSINFRETLKFDHISYHEGGVLDELVSEATKRKGRSFSYDIKVLRVNSLLNCVEAGLGLGIIGEGDLKPYLNNNNVQALRLADKWASRNLVCVYPEGQAASPTLRRFLKYLDLENG